MAESDRWLYDVQTRGVEHLRAIQHTLEGLQARQARQDDLNRRSASAWSGLSSSLTSHAVAIGSAAAAYLSLRTAVSATRSLVSRSIGVTAEMETFRTQFVTLKGSEQAAREELERLFEFAAKTPFELPGVVQARKMMLALGVEGEDTLRIAGDAAAAMGKELSDAILAISQARFGEMERLKEFGISSRMIAAQLGHEINRETIAGQREVADAVLAIFRERYEGGMERLSETLIGKTSTLNDEIRRSFLIIGEAGPFEIVKRDVDELLGILTAANAPGGATEQFADKFALAFAKIESFVWAAGESVVAFLTSEGMDRALARIENVIRGVTTGAVAGAILGKAAGPVGAAVGPAVGGAIGLGVSSRWPMVQGPGGGYVPWGSAAHLGIGGAPSVTAGTAGSLEELERLSRLPTGGASVSFTERQRQRYAETLAFLQSLEGEAAAGPEAARGGKAAAEYVKEAKKARAQKGRIPPGYEYGPMTAAEAGIAGEWTGEEWTEMGPPIPSDVEQELEAQEQLREGWRSTADDFEAAWAAAFGQYEAGFVRMTALSEGGMHATLEATRALTAGMTAAWDLYLSGRLKQERFLSRLLEATGRAAVAGFLDELKERAEKKSREAAIDAAVAFAHGNVGSGASLIAASLGYAALAGVAGGSAQNIRAEAEERLRGLEREDPYRAAGSRDVGTTAGRTTGGASSLRTSSLTPTAITISVVYQHYGMAYYGAGGPDDLIAELAPAINRALESGQIGPLRG